MSSRGCLHRVGIDSSADRTFQTFGSLRDCLAAHRSLFHASVPIQSTFVPLHRRTQRHGPFFRQSRPLAQQFLAVAHWYQWARTPACDRRSCDRRSYHGAAQPLVGGAWRIRPLDGGLIGCQRRVGVLHAVKPAGAALACVGWKHAVCIGGCGLCGSHFRPGSGRSRCGGRGHCVDGAASVSAPAWRCHGVVCGAHGE